MIPHLRGICRLARKGILRKTSVIAPEWSSHPLHSHLSENMSTHIRTHSDMVLEKKFIFLTKTKNYPHPAIRKKCRGSK